MKKIDIIKIGLMVVLAVVSSILIYNNFNNKKDESDKIVITEDEKKFKEEYESLNGKQNSSGKDYPKVEIEENNGIVYSSFDEVKKILTEGTGVIYFGFPECPWCRNSVPMLLQAASNKGLDKIYYYNNKEERDTKSLDNKGKVVTEKEGTKEYYELLTILSNHLGAYEGLNDESIKRLYFPTVVFVLKGEVIGVHIGTLDSQKDPRVELTDEQKTELVNIYTGYISKVLEDVCDDKC